MNFFYFRTNMEVIEQVEQVEQAEQVMIINGFNNYMISESGVVMNI